MTGSATDALRRNPNVGGWRREIRPSLVAFYDAADATHQKALKTLDADGRFCTATRFFNCFRVDAAEKGAGEEGLRFAVFGVDGSALGEVRGAAKPSRLHDLLKGAYSGDLGAACDALDPLVKYDAHCRWLFRMGSAAVVCPDCGELRDDFAADLQALAARRDEIQLQIGALTKCKF